MVHLLLFIIYIAFISLGLPDGLLGAAWPAMHVEMGLSVSAMGIVSLIISGGTVVASLFSDPLTRRYGTGRVTLVSVMMTAAALFGFACSSSLWLLCLWAIPYGLGAGGVDSCLNNYVAIHYSGKHMSWLHCMWGVGASVGPYVMGAVMTGGFHWSRGYLIIGIFQAILVLGLLFTLRIWKGVHQEEENTSQPLSFRQVVKLPGAKQIFLAFFCYCALEQTLGQWASSYFYGFLQMPQATSAALAALYYSGITVGRLINGFLTVRFTDRQLVRAGMAGIGLGLVVMLLPLGLYGTVVGILLAGLGSAPIYPCIIHSTPAIFGAERSQAVIGIEMASAYVGFCVMPPVFGLLADWIGIWCLPVVMMAILLVMFICHERLYAAKK